MCLYILLPNSLNVYSFSCIILFTSQNQDLDFFETPSIIKPYDIAIFLEAFLFHMQQIRPLHKKMFELLDLLKITKNLTEINI